MFFFGCCFGDSLCRLIVESLPLRCSSFKLKLPVLNRPNYHRTVNSLIALSSNTPYTYSIIPHYKFLQVFAKFSKFRRLIILQLNIQGLTASKMNVLHYLALQSKALVILLQETHCTDAEKFVLPNYQLGGSSLSRKHGLGAFVHEFYFLQKFS